MIRMRAAVEIIWGIVASYEMEFNRVYILEECFVRPSRSRAPICSCKTYCLDTSSHERYHGMSIGVAILGGGIFAREEHVVCNYLTQLETRPSLTTYSRPSKHPKTSSSRPFTRALSNQQNPW